MLELKEENASLHAELNRLHAKMKELKGTSPDVALAQTVDHWMEWFYASVSDFQRAHQSETETLCCAAADFYKELCSTQDKLTVVKSERDNLATALAEKTSIITELQTTMRSMLEDCRLLLRAREDAQHQSVQVSQLKYEQSQRLMIELSQVSHFELLQKEKIIDCQVLELAQLQSDVKDVVRDLVLKNHEFARLQDYHEATIEDIRGELEFARAEAQRFKELAATSAYSLRERELELNRIDRKHQVLLSSLRSGMSDLEIEASNLWLSTEAQLCSNSKS
jgi:hypothetical protein